MVRSTSAGGSPTFRRRLSLGIRRRLAAIDPQRRRVMRALDSPAIALLEETGQPVDRYVTLSRVGARPDLHAIPDVTVVVPIFNAERWIEDCLSSVLGQTGVGVEVVCVDDGSTDSSLAVVRRYAREDARVQVIQQVNAGQSVARNAGVDAARGRYIVFVDSDDFWVGDYLAKLVRRADSAQTDVLLFDGAAFLDGNVGGDLWERYARYYIRTREYRRVRGGDAAIAAMRRNGDYRPHVGMYLTRRSFLLGSGVRFIPGIVHQDNPYTFGLLLHAERVAHERLCFYARRLRPGSTITSLKVLGSARGYFLSYLAMSRELATRRTEAQILGPVMEVVNGVHERARKQMSELSDGELRTIRDLDDEMDAQEAFRALTHCAGA